MRILFVSSEINPLIKTGGLADVSRSLPLALQDLGIDVRVLVPGYPSVLKGIVDPQVRHETIPLTGVQEPLRLIEGALPGTTLPLWVVDAPALFDRPGSPYQDAAGLDWADNPQRFGVFCQVAAWLSESGDHSRDWSPDLIHCNDWQSGLIPALIHHRGRELVPTLMTIHNLAFQGNFSPDWIPRLGLPMSSYQVAGLEYYGRFSFLKAGVFYADQITTVSPRYAEEIQTLAFGCGMDGLLRSRSHELTGILNGIDELWNPNQDAALASPYDAEHLANKKLNKRSLQQWAGFRVDPDYFVLGMVSRLTHQKGIDLLLDSLDRLLLNSVQVVVLGSGDAAMEQELLAWEQKHRRQVKVELGFNEALSHEIIAGSDLFLMPSRFEPCGLAQMYAMTYGTPPLVHRTGGLADTVVDYPGDLAAEGATGFVFDATTGDALYQAFLRALACFRHRKAWKTLQQTAMKQDFRWDRAAHEYRGLYSRLLEN